MASQVYIGLGSNIDPERNLVEVASILRENWPQIHFSSVYKTKAREVENQEDFLNAVASFSANDPPSVILTKLQQIESILHKSTPFRFGPRTVDLDVILYDDLVLPNLEIWLHDYRVSVNQQHDPLYIPHIRMHERRFVLEPLCDVINPESEHPVLHVSWAELLASTKDQGCEKTKIVL